MSTKLCAQNEELLDDAKYFLAKQMSFIKYDSHSQKILTSSEKIKTFKTFYLPNNLESIIIVTMDKEPWESEKNDIKDIQNLEKEKILKFYIKSHPEEQHLISLFYDKNIILQKIEGLDEGVIITYYIEK